MLVSRENLFHKISKIYPFNLTNPEWIKILVEKSEVVYFETGNLVFLEGASASNFYIIYEGEVEILVEENQSLRRLNILHDGDFFGEDALKQNNCRKSSARALKNTLLIKIPQNIFNSFISEKPELAQAFSIISRTYTRLFEFKFRDLSNETVYFIGRPHYFVFLSKLFFTIIIMLIPVSIVLILALNNLLSGSLLIGSCIFLVVLYLFQLLWHFLEWRNDFYVITGKRVINLNRHLINYDRRFENPLSAINNLESKKSILGRSIGFGDLVIRTYTGETILKSVTSVSEVQALLEYLMMLEKTTRRNEEQKSFEKIVNNAVNASNSNLSNKVAPSSMSVDPAKNNAYLPRAIYRTHWIILLRKILFPSLLLISLILLMVFFYANRLPLFESSFGFISIGIILIGTFLWWLYKFIDWRNDQYQITQDQIIDIYRKPFGAEDRRTASVLNIQSIRFERKGLLGLLLNFGTVYIRVGDEEFTFDNVPDPARIQEKLFGVLEMSIANLKKSEMTEQQQNMAEWMETYHQVRESKSRGTEINN